MKTATLRALIISVLAGFASQGFASAQADISVNDRGWIKGQQDMLASMKEQQPDSPAALPALVDYEQVMRLPNLNFYVRLPGEYPVVRLKLKYREQKKLHPGLIERNIHDALSPELEKVIQANERAASVAGLAFPTGDEVLEKGSDGATATTISAPATVRQTPVVAKPVTATATPQKPAPAVTAVNKADEPVLPVKHSPVTPPVMPDPEKCLQLAPLFGNRSCIPTPPCRSWLKLCVWPSRS